MGQGENQKNKCWKLGGQHKGSFQSEAKLHTQSKQKELIHYFPFVGTCLATPWQTGLSVCLTVSLEGKCNNHRSLPHALLLRSPSICGWIWCHVLWDIPLVQLSPLCRLPRNFLGTPSPLAVGTEHKKSKKGKTIIIKKKTSRLCKHCSAIFKHWCVTNTSNTWIINTAPYRLLHQKFHAN